jgi:hypothetical protein
LKYLWTNPCVLLVHDIIALASERGHVPSFYAEKPHTGRFVDGSRVKRRICVAPIQRCAGGCLLSSVELGGSSESVSREIFQVKFGKINHALPILVVSFLPQKSSRKDLNTVRRLTKISSGFLNFY